MESSKTKASAKEASRAAEAADPAAQAEPQTQASGNRPVWTKQINRVRGSIWAQDRDGQPRYSTALYRSYFDERGGQWKRVHYYDRDDLPSVREMCDELEKELLRLHGLTQAVGED
jgi:hypothetical protein